GPDQPELRSRQQGDGRHGQRVARRLRERSHRPDPGRGPLPRLAREAPDDARPRARELPRDDRSARERRRDQGVRRGRRQRNGGGLSAEPYPPISDYALLSDCHTSALVSKDGSIDWCCFHRFEARPVFARLLDWGKGGFFRIAPRDEYEVSRRYLPDMNILETTFQTAGGVLVLT